MKTLLLVLCILMAGCTNATVNMAVGTTPPLNDPYAVDVFADTNLVTSKDVTPRPGHLPVPIIDVSALSSDTIAYEILAHIVVRGTEGFIRDLGAPGRRRLIDHARKEAGKIGANGIVIGRYAGATTFTWVRGHGAEADFVAIRWWVVVPETKMEE